ncbi:uncharacterized protein V1516DRAFT_668099 [Lipomyces oligophaga]|uniref:uncharacterized protein n=1 Tax=Lipomyces oligophaga TaxID=45792 RepID=UPI0034CFF6BC
MAAPIRSKRISDLAAAAPTPQNTPASATNSYIASHASEPAVSTIDEEDKAAVAATLANPQLISMIEGRLGGLIGRSSGYIESLPAPVQERVSGLKGLQKDIDSLERDFQKELRELEKKFAGLYKPIFARRAQIVAGEIEPTSEEIEAGKDEDEDEDEEKDEDEKDEDDEDEEKIVSPIPADAKGIPEFWLTALKNMPSMVDVITDRDEEALKFLTDIRSELLEELGFKLYFDFSENEFFENKTLSKTYVYKESTEAGEMDYLYDHAVGDKIQWKPEQDLTVRIEKRKQRNKHTKATRIVKKVIHTDSFFNFFSPPLMESEYADEDEIPEDLEERLMFDYQLGEDLKDKLIPRAVLWYTGEARELDIDDFDGEDDDFEDDDFEDEEGDDDDDEDDDEDDAKPKAETPECKQS